MVSKRSPVYPAEKQWATACPPGRTKAGGISEGFCVRYNVIKRTTDPGSSLKSSGICIWQFILSCGYDLQRTCPGQGGQVRIRARPHFGIDSKPLSTGKRCPSPPGRHTDSSTHSQRSRAPALHVRQWPNTEPAFGLACILGSRRESPEGC